MFRISEAVSRGKCDWCPRSFEPGETVAILPDESTACAESVQEMRELEVAA